MPRMFSIAVATILTLESRSSTQRTGSSKIVKPSPLGEVQQLGVEEPGLVLDSVKQRFERLAPDRLEPALGIGAAHAEQQPEAAGCRHGRSARV